jgi:hypothetical protein
MSTSVELKFGNLGGDVSICQELTRKGFLELRFGGATFCIYKGSSEKNKEGKYNVGPFLLSFLK